MSQHEKNRQKVCATCGEKISIEGQSIKFFHISENIKNQIVNLVYKNFFLLNKRFPISICTTCRITPAEHTAGVSTRPLPEMKREFENIDLQQMSRSRNKECRKGSSTVHKKIVTGWGHKKKFESCAETNENSISKRLNTSKICGKCYQKIGKGIRHPCVHNKKIKLLKENNVEELV